MARSSDDSPDPAPESDSGTSRVERRRSRAIAEFLLDIGAVALRPSNPFTWTSGLVAPIYCDNRLTISHPRARRAIRDGFAELVSHHSFTPATIAGTATAGIPHAAWLAEAVDQPMAYIRSSAKGHGQGARIEGVVKPGDDVLVVEDLISTGGSALDAVAVLREVGATVPAVLAIFSYELDAAEASFEEAAVPRHVLTTFGTLVDVAHERDDLSVSERDALRAWRADPGSWSVEHGGDRPD